MLSFEGLRRWILRGSFTTTEKANALASALTRAIWTAGALAFAAIVVGLSGRGLFSAVVLVVAGFGSIAAIGLVWSIARVSYITLRDEAFRPLDEVAIVARRLAGGDLQVPAVDVAVAPEIQQVVQTLGILANAVVVERGRRDADRHQSDRENSSLREILEITRRVGGDLEEDAIYETLADGCRRIGGFAEVIVWTVDEKTGDLVAAYPPELKLGPSVDSRLRISEAPAGRAATSAQTVRLRADGARPSGMAVPLVIGGVALRILGVVEVRGEGFQEAITVNPIDALEVLAAHTAAALTAVQARASLEARSETDALTKVFNRRKLDADLKGEVARSRRYGHELTLIMVDVDHFKSINDTFGHQMGDEVLKKVAATINTGRETDAAYRFGGEEFAVLLRETDWRSGRAVAERLRTRIRDAVSTLDLGRDVTASLGVASITPAIATPDKLVEAADAALYQAKETGRNRVVVSPAASGHEGVPQPGPPAADAV